MFEEVRHEEEDMKDHYLLSLSLTYPDIIKTNQLHRS